MIITFMLTRNQMAIYFMSERVVVYGNIKLVTETHIGKEL